MIHSHSRFVRFGLMAYVVLSLCASGVGAFPAVQNALKFSRPRALKMSSKDPNLEVVRYEDKEYYRTFRVDSPQGFARITDSRNYFRFNTFAGYQYGQGFYLFSRRVAAEKFVRCNQKCGQGERNVIAEVLLPKERFDSLKKAFVPSSLDWGLEKRDAKIMTQFRDLMNSNRVLFGRWAAHPIYQEPHYNPMKSAEQIVILSPLWRENILFDAVIRKADESSVHAPLAPKGSS